MLPFRYSRFDKLFLVALLLAFFPVCLLLGWTVVKYPQFVNEHPGSDAGAWFVSIGFWLVLGVMLAVVYRREHRDQG
jgi:hypothetical protein